MNADIPWAGVLPIIVVAVGFIVYCLIDISRHEVKHLPKWAWALICLMSVPLGGIAYLMLGKDASST
ncbi:PLD nuclease N-terminal domain-containing protein [Demequina sp.]|uniref:PLD nuclease N-terminal domain-containing protein n=1 Tax=Demequina sp. TaxID=2050685 RepID=UPI0025C1EFA7|nr:PLD nuclease N-terminal domain-containing protein [Demequina sp.]